MPAPLDRNLSTVGAVLMAMAFLATGAAILALAFGAIAVDPARLSAPRWVIASAGAMFVAGGFVPLSLSCGFSAWVNHLVGLIAAASLGAVLNWIAFFPDERHFTGITTLFDLHLPVNSGGEMTGRVLFGLFALLLDAIVVTGLWRLLRGAGGARSPGNMKP